MLGERLRQLRCAHDYRQTYVADQLGITRAAYAYYELDQRQPTPENMIRLADLYQVSIDYLVGRTELPSHVVQKNTVEAHLLKQYRMVDLRGKSIISDAALFEANLARKMPD